LIFYRKEVNNYLKTTGIVNNMLRPQKILKKTRRKLYNTLALPAVLYSSENWTITARDTRRIMAAEMEIHEKDSRMHLD
jgi:hypothetical protein